jgi:TP901 family phage tail tape measure protein
MSSGSIGGIWVDVALKFPDLGKSVQGVGSAFRSVGVHIGAGIGAAIRGSTAAIAGLGAAVGAALGGAVGLFATGIQVAIKGLSIGIGIVSSLLTGAVSLFAGGLTVALRGAGVLIRGIASGVAGIISGIGSTIQSAYRMVGSLLSSVGSVLTSLFFGIGPILVSALGSAFTVIGSVVGALATGLANAVSAFGGLLQGALNLAGMLVQGVASILIGAARTFTSILQGGLDAIGRVVGGIGQALMQAFGAVGTAAGGVLGFSADEAIKWEARMASIRRITGAEGRELAGIEGTIRKIITTLPGVGMGEVFDIAKIGGRMGIQGSQLAAFTKSVSELSIALDDLPIEQAATKIGRLMGVFGMSASETRRLGSVLVGLDNASKATADEILNISMRIAPFARAARMSATDTLALSAALRDAGVNVEVAGTNMSQIIGKMAGKNLPAFARLAGVSAQAFKQAFGADPLRAIGMVAAGLEHMNIFEATHALEGLGLNGQRTRQTLLALSSVLPTLGRFSRMAADEFVSMASIERAMETRAGTTEAALQLLWNQVRVGAKDLGVHALPAIKAFSKGLGFAFDDIGKFLRDNQATLTRWGERAADAVSYVGLVFSEYKTYTALAWSYVREFFERAAVAGQRFGLQLRDNFAVAWGNVQLFAEKAFKGIGNFLEHYIPKLASYVGGLLSKAFADKFPMLSKALGIEAPSADVMEQRRAALLDPGNFRPLQHILPAFRAAAAPMPGFDMGGVFAAQGMPNRAGERVPLQDRLRGARDRQLAGLAEERMTQKARREAQSSAMAPGIQGALDAAIAPEAGPRGRRMSQVQAQREAFNAQVRDEREMFNMQERMARDEFNRQFFGGEEFSGAARAQQRAGGVERPKAVGEGGDKTAELSLEELTRMADAMEDLLRSQWGGQVADWPA